MNHKSIYMDFAATTPVDPKVLLVMQKAEKEVWGNPSSLHKEGVLAKKLLDESRAKIARSLECKKEDLVFTSGGTEANNLAIFGVVNKTLESRDYKDIHIITTNIEHSSVLEPIRHFERKGVVVTYLKVNEKGIVSLSDLEKALNENTILVSIQYANSEIGTIQPIRKIAKLIQLARPGDSRFVIHDQEKGSTRPIFHTDASQAPLYLNCVVNRLEVDLMTLDAHKIYGPKGVGLLYVRKNIPIVPIIFGGGQERGVRSTTENVPGIAGFAKAMEIAVEKRESESERLLEIRNIYHNIMHDALIDNKGCGKRLVLNGSFEKDERLPNNINISIEGVDAEFVVLQLDARGISCSTKSSCEEGEEESYVVRALGGEKWRAKSTIRFSFGRTTKKTDLEKLVQFLKEILK